MKNILVIRRDNIGDLVCTTPLFSGLRTAFPAARIAALVNSYNAPVLDGNPDIDEVFVYTKGKHRDSGTSLWSVWWKTWQLMRRLGRVEWDAVFVATTARAPQALKFAKRLHAKRIIGYGSREDGLTDPLSLPGPDDRTHECEWVMHLMRPLGLSETPGPVRVFPSAALVAPLRATLPAGHGPVVGLHISARKPAQRWPVENFASLARQLHAEHGARLLLFWSPGAADDARHPGDDTRAAELLDRCQGIPIQSMPTARLEELIAGLSLCDQLVCSDGGAMHLAAGLSKPMVCFFGNSQASRWRPWGVPHRLLQPASENVIDVSVAQARQAYEELVRGIPVGADADFHQ